MATARTHNSTMNKKISTSLNGCQVTDNAYYKPALPKASGRKLGHSSSLKKPEENESQSGRASSTTSGALDLRGNDSVIVLDSPQPKSGEGQALGTEMSRKRKGKMRKRRSPVAEDEVQIVDDIVAINGRSRSRETRARHKKHRQNRLAEDVIDLTSDSETSGACAAASSSSTVHVPDTSGDHKLALRLQQKEESMVSASFASSAGPRGDRAAQARLESDEQLARRLFEEEKAQAMQASAAQRHRATQRHRASQMHLPDYNSESDSDYDPAVQNDARGDAESTFRQYIQTFMRNTFFGGGGAAHGHAAANGPDMSYEEKVCNRAVTSTRETLPAQLVYITRDGVILHKILKV
eukprot:m.524664 g.524664  ORF g.524664 m.524664 type:complete len:352 (-) comp21990_c0_seq7:28-1083(-)